MKESIVLDGKLLSLKLENELKEEVAILKEKTGKVATLATIIVGNDEASKTYVKMKGKACERIGIDSIKIELDENTTTEDLIAVIDKLNKDDAINGILLQHPVPKHIDERACFNAISLEKDVDGVTSMGFGKIAMGEEAFSCATPLGIIKLLDYYKVELEGKLAVVIGRSPILGKPLAMMLLNKNATVTIAHSKTKKIENIVKSADIVVACVGKSNFVKKEWLKKGCVVIDAGYNKGGIGDVELESAKEVVSAYTPVPGGVGPMTIVSLMEQTVKAFKFKNNL